MNDVVDTSSVVIREPARLKAVRRTALLDTPAEEAFDRLTRLTAQILDTPIALISLLDEDRLFFKSSFGLNDPEAVRELPLAQTFCQNNVTLRQPLVIEDAHKHTLVCNHPAVEAFNVGGYLGVPLFDSAGHGLGALCVIDHQPRTWGADQVATLQDLAATVITEIELRIAAREAEAARDQVTRILENISDGFIALDADWRFTYINAKAGQLMQMTRAEALGGNHWQLFPATLGTVVEAEYRRALQQQITVEFENYYAPWDRWYNIKASPSRDGGLSIFFHEISALKQAELQTRAAAEQLRLITDSIPALIAYVDKDGYYRLNNQAYETWFGSLRAEITGRHIQDVMGKAAWAKVQPHLESAFAGQTVSYESIMPYKDGGTRYKDGGTRWVSATYTPHFDAGGEVAGIAVLVNDITALKQADDDTRRQKLLFEALIESVLDGILIVSPEGRMLHFNQRFLDIWNFPPEVTQSQSDETALQWAANQTMNPAAFLARVSSVYEHPDDQVREELLMKDGRVYERFGAPIHSNDARLGWVWTFRDITERKQAEASLRSSEAHFQALADNMSQFAWITDEKGWIFWYNQRWYDYTGTTLEEMQGWGWQKVHHPDHVQRVVDKFSSCLASGEVWEDSFPLRGTDGNYRWFLSRALPIRDEDGKIIRWFGTNTDITEQRQAETQLANFAMQLQRSNRELQDFASVASHDLQEPLRKIQTFGERLQANAGKQLNKQGQDYLARMQNAARRMQDLINDLIAFSRVTTKAQPFLPVDLGVVAHAVVSDLEVQVAETDGRVEVDELPTIDADPMQMRQLLQNLISNALKFHRPGVPPLIKIQAELVTDKDSGGKICQLSVMDNGIGFEEQYLDRIFTMFERLHGRNDYEGTGIGLAICRRIAERHGGSITAKSLPGQGANFIICLPIEQLSIN